MEITMDFLLSFIIFGVGFWLGWHIRNAIFIYRISENPERVMEILAKIKEINEEGESDSPSPKGTQLRIEKHGPTLYAFASENNEFIAQGPTLKELLETAHKRFPGRVFFGEIPNDDPAKELA